MGTALRLSKNLSLRASAHAGVAIRSLKCSVFMGIADKNSRFGDADCHVASLLAMTFFRLELFRHTEGRTQWVQPSFYAFASTMPSAMM